MPKHAKLSPAFWPLKPGRSFDAVVGGLKSSEFKRQAKLITDAWQSAAKTRYEEIAGTNHFTVVDPLGDPWQRDDGARRRTR